MICIVDDWSETKWQFNILNLNRDFKFLIRFLQNYYLVNIKKKLLNVK